MVESASERGNAGAVDAVGGEGVEDVGDRVYRPAFPLSDALSTMRDGRATHFDADLLDLFFDSLDDVLAAREGVTDAAIP